MRALVHMQDNSTNTSEENGRAGGKGAIAHVRRGHQQIQEEMEEVRASGERDLEIDPWMKVQTPRKTIRSKIRLRFVDT